MAVLESWRWESDRRYYCAVLHHDLLDYLVIERFWGGLHNRLGGHTMTPVMTEEAGRKLLQEIHKRRLAHHYSRIK